MSPDKLIETSLREAEALGFGKAMETLIGLRRHCLVTGLCSSSGALALAIGVLEVKRMELYPDVLRKEVKADDH